MNANDLGRQSEILVSNGLISTAQCTDKRDGSQEHKRINGIINLMMFRKMFTSCCPVTL